MPLLWYYLNGFVVPEVFVNVAHTVFKKHYNAIDTTILIRRRSFCLLDQLKANSTSFNSLCSAMAMTLIVFSRGVSVSQYECRRILK